MDGNPVVSLLYGKHLLLEGEFLLGNLGQQQVVENWTRENKVVVPKAGERTIAKGCDEKLVSLFVLPHSIFDMTCCLQFLDGGQASAKDFLQLLIVESHPNTTD